MGRMDEDGFLSITGRIKEMLIIGGENVFPREIEEVLDRHPSIKSSAIIGQADPSRGEVPLAFVELVEDAEFDPTALRSHCRETLAQYKVPREIRRCRTASNPTGTSSVQLTPETPGMRQPSIARLSRGPSRRPGSGSGRRAQHRASGTRRCPSRRPDRPRRDRRHSHRDGPQSWNNRRSLAIDTTVAIEVAQATARGREAADLQIADAGFPDPGDPHEHGLAAGRSLNWIRRCPPSRWRVVVTAETLQFPQSPR